MELLLMKVCDKIKKTFLFAAWLHRKLTTVFSLYSESKQNSKY